MTEPRRRRWARWIAGAGALVLAALGTYAYVIRENVSQRARVDAACAVVIPETRRWMSGRSAHRLFAEDAPLVRRLWMQNTHAWCDTVRRQLDWWRWNVGTTLAIPVDRERQRQLADAFRRARVRCPAVTRPMLSDLEGLASASDRDRARADIDRTVARVCALATETIERLNAPHQAVPVYGWSAVLETQAAALTRARESGSQP